MKQAALSVAGRRAPFPPILQPELATLVSEAPTGDAWVHEIKFDGYRFLAYLRGGRVRLFSRNGRGGTRQLPRLCALLAVRFPAKTAVLDGELVALNEDGISDFSALKD